MAFQSLSMLSTRDRRSHMVFKISFPFLSTKHWPVKTVMESAGTGWEVEVSVAKAWPPGTGDSRLGLSLPSGDSGDGESRQEGSEGWGSHVELGREQWSSAPSASSVPQDWEVTPTSQGAPGSRMGERQGHHRGWESTGDTAGKGRGSSRTLQGRAEEHQGHHREGRGPLGTPRGGRERRST